MRLGGARVGLIAGLMVAANLELFLFARLVKPDLLFVLCILARLRGLPRGLPRRAGRAALAPALLRRAWARPRSPRTSSARWGRSSGGAVLRRHRRAGRGAPVDPAGPASLLLLAVAAPWYLLVEARNPGFLWYTMVDNHLLNFARQRVFPDEDVPLGRAGVPRRHRARLLSVVPGAAAGRSGARLPRRPWPTAERRVWMLLALWTRRARGSSRCRPSSCRTTGCPRFPRWRSWSPSSGTTPSSGAAGRAALLPAPGARAARAGRRGRRALAAWLGWLRALPGRRVAAAPTSPRATWPPRARPRPSDSRPQLRAALRSRSPVIFRWRRPRLAVAAWRRLPRPRASARCSPRCSPSCRSRSRASRSSPRAARSGRSTDAVALRVAPEDVLAHEGAHREQRLLAPAPAIGRCRSSMGSSRTSRSARPFPRRATIFWDAAALRARLGGGPARLPPLGRARRAGAWCASCRRTASTSCVEAGGRRLYSNRP